MTRLVLVLTFAAWATAGAQSQRSSPQQGSAEGNKPATPDTRGTKGAPLVVEIEPTPKGDQEAAEHQRQIERDEATAYWNEWSARTAIGFGFFQLVAIGLQVWILLRQNKIIDGQSNIMSEQRSLMEGTLRASREIERAYISLGHSAVHVHGTPDGKGGQDPKKPKRILVVMFVRNSGNTPGSSLGGFLGFSIGAKPSLPRTESLSGPSVGFLLPDKELSFPVPIEQPAEVLESVMSGTSKLWLIGEIDYVDRFGGLHTCGYARLFDPNLDGPNRAGFGVGHEVSHLNFDRPMAPERRKQYRENGRLPKE